MMRKGKTPIPSNLKIRFFEDLIVLNIVGILKLLKTKYFIICLDDYHEK